MPVEDDAVPSWLEHGPREAPASPFDLQVDAARERLRRAIPPVDDDA